METKQILNNEIDYKLQPKGPEPLNEFYLEPSTKLITNSDNGNLLNELKKSLYEAKANGRD